MGKLKREQIEREGEFKTSKDDGIMEEVTPKLMCPKISTQNSERSEILSPLGGPTIKQKPELKTSEGSFVKNAQDPSGLSSARHPKVFVKTFGWPLSTL